MPPFRQLAFASVSARNKSSLDACARNDSRAATRWHYGKRLCCYPSNTYPEAVHTSGHSHPYLLKPPGCGVARDAKLTASLPDGDLVQKGKSM